MSLALLQGYSSEEEEEQGETLSCSSISGNEDEDCGVRATYKIASPEFLNSSTNSSLPSAFSAFAEVVGPPEFLNNSVAEGDKQDGEKGGGAAQRGKGRGRREKRDLPPGAVVEAKPQLVGIRERVRSDIEVTSQDTASGGSEAAEGKRLISASNPGAKDAADLLRMCLQCGVPKTYSHARGVVCPVCGDRPVSDTLKESEKKKGSTIKVKEKSKRMKGQSSHATWKSETEMHLRQQYD